MEMEDWLELVVELVIEEEIDDDLLLDGN